MSRVLVLFAHPRLEKSRANAALLKRFPVRAGITFHDLYEEYPDYNVDTGREKELLAAHEVIVWHHPFYWYGAPPLVKVWLDVALEVGWAYGPGGEALAGKTALNVLTSGGAREAYGPKSRNRLTVRQFLAPFEQTARLCGMRYLPPWAVQGTHRIAADELDGHAREYARLLEALAGDAIDMDRAAACEFLNDLFAESREG